jgi:hypothetical protein
MPELIEIAAIYEGSDGDRTKALYERLMALGPAGVVATNVFRACKNSERAKKYRGGNGRGRYRDQAYERKQWALDNLAKALERHAADLGVGWGWGIDDKQDYHRHVLYVDLPSGQVSFHTEARGSGPDYPGQWDGVRGASASRACSYAKRVMDGGA